MKELFTAVLNMSFTATIAVICVIIIRAMLRKAPKIFSYALWSLVLFRLLVPFSFETSVSLMPENSESIAEGLVYLQNYNITETEFSNNSDIIHSAENKGSTDINSGNNLKNISEVEAPIINSEKAREESMNTLAGIGSVIWISGILALISYSVITYAKLSSNLEAATLVRDNIFESDRITTPFVIGLVKPKIIIPINLKETELKYILAHESIHIGRGDNIIKPLAFFALIIHWFNPFIWLSYYLMVKDMEMSCDESVMNKANEDIRENYSYSLLSLSVKQRALLTPLAFGESNVKSRIKNILNYKKPSFWVMAVLVILLIVVAVSVGTNPKKNNYEFSGMTWVQDSDKYLYVEDTPDSIQEELVYLDFLYSVEKDYDKKNDIISDRHRISIDNERKTDPDVYSSYVIHSITTVDKNLRDYEYFVKKNNLTEFEVINVIYTKKDSLNLTVMGPQWGDGTYSRGYIIGKTAEDTDYKIHDFMLPLEPDYSEVNSEILSSSVQLYAYENNELFSEREITDTVSKTNINMLLRNVDEVSRISDGDAAPKTGNYIKAVINDKAYYIYEINSKYYIEEPNKNISSITFNEYRAISDYNILGVLPEPVFISTVISGVTLEDYKETGNDNTENPNLNDFRKIQFKLYIEYPNNIKNRKVEIPNLQMLKKGDEENRLRGGSTFERDNEAEKFAVYEHEFIFDVNGLNDDDIKNILNSKEASVSWIDGNNYTFEYNYNIGEIAEFANN